MPKAAPTPSFPLNGMFPVAKPTGPTSMRLIDSITPLLLESRLFDDASGPRIRPKEKNKRKRNTTHMGLKIGQGGTLDPLADGVLVLGVNRGTKHLNRFLTCSKEYESIGMLGAATTSYDAESPILHTGNFDNITREDIEKVLDQFRGVIKQTPPIFSALKMDGKPLYEYARESKPLPRAIPVREVTVSIDLIDFTPAEVVPGDGGHQYVWPKEVLSAEEKGVFSRLNKMVHEAGDEAATAEPEIDLSAPDVPEVSPQTGLRPATFKVRMTVSSGTYVRSIVHDIGLALGCGAHVVKLTRTRQGEFVLRDDQEKAAVGATEETKEDVKEEASSSAVAIDDEEAAMNAAQPVVPVIPDKMSLDHPEGATTTCIAWDVFERAIAERKETLQAEAAGREEAHAMGTSAEEIEAQFGEHAIANKRRAGPLKEWENEVLKSFVPVPLPIVRDSKSRAAGLY